MKVKRNVPVVAVVEDEIATTRTIAVGEIIVVDWEHSNSSKY